MWEWGRNDDRGWEERAGCWAIVCPSEALQGAREAVVACVLDPLTSDDI